MKKNNPLRFLSFLAAVLFFSAAQPHIVFAQQSQAVIESSQNQQDRVDFANGLYNRNMYEMAILEYDAILEENSQHPDAGTILFRLAESHFFLKKYEEAISIYQSFTQSHSDHPQIETARLRLGEILYQLGDKDSSLNQMQNLTQSSDIKIKQIALYFTGKIYYEKENYVEAQKSLLQITENPEENPYRDIAYYYLGESYLKTNDFDKASNQFLAIKDSNKNDLKQLSLFNLGKTAYHKKDFKSAGDFFYQASLINENVNLADDSFLNYLNSLYALKDFSKLTQVFRERKQQSTDKEAALMLLAANSYLQLEKYEETVTLVDEILKIPNIDLKQKETAELNKIEALVQIGDVKRSKVALEEMSAERKYFKEKWLFLSAQIYKDAQSTDASLDNFNQLIQNNSVENTYRAQALIGKAYTLLEAKKTEDARATLAQFIQEYPQHPFTAKAAYDHILLDVKLKDWPGAIARSKEFLDHFKGDKNAQDVQVRLASFYLQIENYKDALNVYETYLKTYTLSDPDKQEIFFYQAYANQLDNQNQQAIEYYKKIEVGKIKEGLYVSALKNMAFLYVSENQTDEAASSYLTLIRHTKKNDLSPDVYFWLADHYLAKKDGVAMSDILLSLNSQNETSHLRADIDYFLAEASFLKSEFEKTEALSKQAVELGTTHLSKAELVRGKALQALNRHSEAILAFEASLKSAGNQHRVAMLARLHMADTYALLNDYEKAAKAYLAVAILYDDDETIPGTLIKAGEYFEKTSLFKEASAAYQELIERFPEHEFAVTAKNALQKLTNH